MKNFDAHLRSIQTREQYRLNKSKAGRMSSTKGKPRPYAKSLMLKALLHSPKVVGYKYTVKPKKNGILSVNNYYIWEVTEPGVGKILGHTITADELYENFIIIPKNKIPKR